MEDGLSRGLVKSVAAKLRERVVPAHVGDFMPGSRILAQTLGVSVPTVCKALRLLGAEGVLTSGGGRKRWRVADQVPDLVAADRGVAGGRGRSRRLLFIAPRPLEGERYSGVEIFAALLDRLATTEWEVMYRVIGFWDAKKPRRSWDELLESARPDAIVALTGTEVLGKWALGRNVRTLFIGGTLGESGVSMMAVSVSSMLRDAAGRLLGLGHRRILFPLCGRASLFVEKIRAASAELTTAQGRPANNVIIATSRYSDPEVLINLLRRQWRKRPPDALILLDWREFVAAESFFGEQGIVIPRDLSVILLSQNAAMDWRRPAISHYEQPVVPIARAVAKWVRNEAPARNPGGAKEFKARWVSKQSVRPRSGSGVS